MTLKSLSQLGRVEKEFEINKELTVKLHTLSTVEQQKVLLEFPETELAESVKYVYLQQSLLVFATDEINKEKPTREELKEFYTNLQYSVLLDIFSKYLELSSEQQTILEELKKK